LSYWGGCFETTMRNLKKKGGRGEILGKELIAFFLGGESSVKAGKGKPLRGGHGISI